jgi:uncharacterized protein
MIHPANGEKIANKSNRQLYLCGHALRAGLDSAFRYRLITLNVHSSLEAVGLLAAVTTRLAAAGISVNAVSAVYHDHLFVAPGRAEEACGILRDLMVNRAEQTSPGHR